MMWKSVLVFLVACIVVVGFGECVTAQVVSGINQSSIGNGDSITLSGSGFGSKSTADPLISSYDGGSDSFHAMTVDATPTGNWDVNSGALVNLRDDAEKRTSFYQSDKYVEIVWVGWNGGVSPYPSLRYYGASSNTKHYLSAWYYFTESCPIPMGGGGGNSKILAQYPNTGCNCRRHLQMISENEPDAGDVATWRHSSDGLFPGLGGDSVSWANVMPSNICQRWIHIEWYTDVGTLNNLDGFLHEIIDGKKTLRWGDYDETPIGWISASVPHSANMFALGDVSGSPTDTRNILLSDVYIDNTQAHVFISDKSDITAWDNYGSTAPTEVQVASTWLNNSIIFTVNQGSFPNGTAYLYVVNENGTVSNSHPITFGDSFVNCSGGGDK